jgi:hypothetical protein
MKKPKQKKREKRNNTKQERRSWPTTVEDAVERVITSLSDKQREQFRAMPEKDLGLLHFGLAMSIRAVFGLWKGNTKLLRDYDMKANSRFFTNISWQDDGPSRPRWGIHVYCQGSLATITGFIGGTRHSKVEWWWTDIATAPARPSCRSSC